MANEDVELETAVKDDIGAIRFPDKAFSRQFYFKS